MVFKNLDQIIASLERLPYAEASGKPMTLRAAMKIGVGEALPDPGEIVSNDEKLSRFNIQVKVFNATNETDFSVEEVAKIKLLVGKYFKVEPMGVIFGLIEASAGGS